MKFAFPALLVAVLAVCSGCENGTTGGPGATTKPNQSAGQPEETFRLDLPNLATKVKQGETKSIAIGIKRAKNFDEDVQLKFADAPKGVAFDPAKPVIKHGDKDTQITVKASDDAALGDFTVHVVGHPTKGPDAHNELKITVEKK